MDEKKVIELRKFVGIITDPKISALLDLKKLSKSGIFNQSVEMASDHAVKHNDFTYLNKLFALVDGSAYESTFIIGLRSKIDFVITESTPRTLKKATREQMTAAAKRAQGRAAAAKSTPSKQPKSKSEQCEHSHDLLDSRLILPGSYGSGKRK